MSNISAAMVKELREKTGAGMLDCKKTLEEAGGDMEKAIDLLREKGLAKAAKKSGRTAADGLVAVLVEGTSGAVVEINAETDFVARNEEFQNFVRESAKLALQNKVADEAALKNVKASSGKPVGETLTDLIARIGENMSLRRATSLAVSNGAVVGYVHNALTDGLGKIGVLVALESSGDAGKLETLGKQIAMHIAAMNPVALTADQVPADLLEREKAIYTEKAKASGKPADIIGKMVEGSVRKYYEEVVLLEQPFVMDGKTKISQVLIEAAKDVGDDVKITGYTRYELGEGIEKEVTNLADEVAAQLAS